MKLTFGKFKGQLLENTPQWYQTWLTQQDWFNKPQTTVQTLQPKQLTAEEREVRKAKLEKTNDVKTLNRITYKGETFEIEGKHKYRYEENSKLFFTIWLTKPNTTDKSGIEIPNPNKLKSTLEELINSDKEKQVRAIYYASRRGLTTLEILNHNDFRYGRFIPTSDGGYYNLYFTDIYSPTGVSLAGGCNIETWERLSKETNNSHNYLVGNEGRKIAC